MTDIKASIKAIFIIFFLMTTFLVTDIKTSIEAIFMILF